MQEGTPGARSAINDFLTENLVIGAVIRFLIADQLQKPGPAPAQANDLITLAQCADGNSSNSRVESRNVAPAREYCNSALARHDECLLSSMPPLYTAT